MVFAIATRSSVYFYDTQQKTPFGIVSNIHYTRLTDLAWSDNGQILVVSSTDGFCSIITFENGELGEVYTESTVKKDRLQDVTNTKKDNLDSTKPLKPEEEIEIRKSPIDLKPIIEAGDKIIEIPCDKILSVAGKFSSPDKKDKPATPIAIRKHPRAGNNITGSDEDIAANKKTPPKEDVTGSTSLTVTPGNRNKGATPIAIRRKPRTPLSNSKVLKQKKTESPSSKLPVIESSVNEEAVDAWPIDEPKPISAVKKDRLSIPEQQPPPPSECFMSPGESDKTQDIVLMVDDDDENSSEKIDPSKTESENLISKVQKEIEKMDVDETEPKIETEIASTSITPKTPRRVEFRTISTPKSKKKLL